MNDHQEGGGDGPWRSSKAVKAAALKKKTGHFGKTTPKNEGEHRFMSMMKKQKGRIFENNKE